MAIDYKKFAEDLGKAVEEAERVSPSRRVRARRKKSAPEPSPDTVVVFLNKRPAAADRR